jgi:hypothetical protein
MISTIGSKPPLHRKFNEADSLKQIRSRYVGLKGKFDPQLEVLRSSDRFLERCQKPYAAGYKDWHILSAILNRLLMLESAKRGIDLATKEGRNAQIALMKEPFTGTFPESEFDGPEWEIAFKGHAITCLRTYGFEERSAAVRPDAVVKFLRERMKHFDLDIPHQPMFEKPLGDWPDVEAD